MLPTWSIFCPLKVATMLIESNFEIEKPQKLNDANKSVFENGQIFMPRILSVLQILLMFSGGMAPAKVVTENLPISIKLII